MALVFPPAVTDFFQLLASGAWLLLRSAQGSPVPLGVFLVALVVGLGIHRWVRSVGRRLARGVRLRPIVLTAPSPPRIVIPPLWDEESIGSAPGGFGSAPPAAAGTQASLGPGLGFAFARPAAATAPAASSAQPAASSFPATAPPRIPGAPPTSADWDEEDGGEGQGAPPPPRPAAPSRPPPAPVNFGWKLTAFFALFAAPMLYFSGYFFAVFDWLVSELGALVYWPRPWPGPGSAGSPLTAPDYIFIMYFAFFLAYGAAFLAARRGRLRPEQRSAALLTVGSYLFFAILLDVFFDAGATPLFLTSLTIVARALLGGLFLAILQFVTLVVPQPLNVDRRFARRRSAIAIMFAAGAASVLAALVLLYAAWLFLGVGRSLLDFAILLLLPIYSYLIWVLFGRVLYSAALRARPPPPLSAYHPPVTIIIPAYNEEDGIAEAIRCADAAAARYPGSVEILVGNDGSTDRTSAIAHEAMGRLSHARGRVLDLPHGGKSNALNGMLRAATGEILVRVDADCRIDPEVGFGEVVRHFADPEVGGVQGMLLPLQQEGWTRKLRLLELCFNHLFLRPAQMGFRAAQVVDGAFCAFRRKDLLSVGGWADWNGEDTEITLRLQRIGFATRFEPGALAREDVPATYNELKKQRIRWSRGGVFAHMRHYGSLFSEAPEYGGLALLVWIAMFMRGGMRHLVYLYALLATLLLGLPTLLHLGEIVLLLLLPRALVLSVYLGKLRRYSAVPWISFWPVAGALKQYFTVESFGTMLPGAIPEFSE